ncbi:MAG: plastocyanin/azurin family copper-binding protein [Mycobacteriales bacterium]|nr:plastocyanin/azurin family copper-binding protein [Mycobacteriales bacterium]
MRRTALAAAGLGLLALTACGGGESTSASSDEPTTASGPVVKMPLTQFDPAKISIKTGDTLTWENSNDIGHTLVQGTYEVDAAGQRTSEKDDGTFTLDVKKKGDKVTHTYATAGTFDYYCTIHKAMNGTVTVA